MGLTLFVLPCLQSRKRVGSIAGEEADESFCFAWIPDEGLVGKQGEETERGCEAIQGHSVDDIEHRLLYY